MKWFVHLDDNIDDGEQRYSITLKENVPGWRTDSGYVGYGLPKELAQWICDTLNKHGKDCPYEMDEFGCWMLEKEKNEKGKK